MVLASANKYGSVHLRHSTVVKFRSMRLDTTLSLKLAQS